MSAVERGVALTPNDENVLEQNVGAGKK